MWSRSFRAGGPRASVARTPVAQVAVPDRAASPPRERSAAANLLISLRPEQWVKNFFVFAALIFSLRLTDLRAVAVVTAAFVVFCVLSGVVYLVNDVADRRSDAGHPIKARRPIVYLSLMVLYSGPLRHVVILDVLAISIGFVLRVFGGAVVIDVPVSHWLLVCTILLALFLALSKRRHELVLLADAAKGHRRILQEYSPYLLDQMIGVVTASTVMAYMLYATSPETAEKFGTSLLGLTIPFPLYGIFRYLYLVHQKEGGGSPSEMLLTDRPLLLCVALWGIAIALIIYRPFGI
jgi:4-hydroxybenzoate polyprenyltransferase